MKPKLANLLVRVNDKAKAVDNIGMHKPWFNGMKFFHTVKVLPPQK